VIRVHIPSPLYSYTGGKAEAGAEGSSLGAVLVDLDRQYPGLRFRIIDEQDRIRPHIRIYLRDRFVFDLAEPVAEDGEVHIIAALSGG